MKYVQANTLMYDATLGRVDPGGTYYVEDDKAERWVVAGVAALAPARETPPAPPAPPVPDPQPIPPEPPEPIPPEPEPEPEEGEESEEEHAKLRAEVKRLFNEEGQSQRAIAEKMGMSRQRVHDLLRI